MSEKKWYLTTTYEEAKNIIAINLQDMSRKFIAIGFYLKHVRDNKMYLEDGYKDIWEFAKDLYGIQRSTASRWMAINDKFSEDGNSPILLEQYRNFGKSQLQEMLYLPDEKLEQVTANMTVKEIREMKEPEKKVLQKPTEEQEGYLKAFARYLLACKHNWFAQKFHERVTNVETSPKELKEHLGPSNRWWHYSTDKGVASIDLFDDYVQVHDEKSNYVGDFEWFYLARAIQVMWNVIALEEAEAERQRKEQEEAQKKLQEETCATSHKLEESGCPPEQSDCMRQEWGTSPEQQEIGRKECKKCWSHWKRLHSMETTKESEPVIEAEYKELPEEQIPGQLGVSDYDGVTPEYEGVVPNDSVGCDKMEEIVSKQVESVPECKESVSECKETASKITPQSVLEEHKTMLEDWLKAFEGEDIPVFVEKEKILVTALASLVSDLELEEAKNEVIEQTQPELPVMRNNDQRKAFLNSYQTWPIWFEVPEASEMYHRFDLPDGSSIVVCEYHMYLEWKERYADENPHSVGKRLYLLKLGYHYLQDCMTNETALIEHLKGLRK